jgi:hypothetical protein
VGGRWEVVTASVAKPGGGRAYVLSSVSKRFDQMLISMDKVRDFQHKAHCTFQGFAIILTKISATRRMVTKHFNQILRSRKVTMNGGW